MMSEKDLVQRFKLFQKMQLVASSWNLRDKNLGQFLRANGISSPELFAWREQMQEGLERGLPVIRSEKRRYKDEIAKLKEEVRQLRELNEIQKKVQVLYARNEAKNTVKKLGRESVQSSKKASRKK
jgi:transposase-like protein